MPSNGRPDVGSLEAIGAYKRTTHKDASFQSHWTLLLWTLLCAVQHKEMRMAKGTVKWFNPTKGYGFIQPQGGGGKDVFVHISAVEKAGLSTLNEGQVVEYEEVPNKGKTSAENLKVQR